MQSRAVVFAFMMRPSLARRVSTASTTQVAKRPICFGCIFDIDDYKASRTCRILRPSHILDNSKNRLHYQQTNSLDESYCLDIF